MADAWTPGAALDGGVVATNNDALVPFTPPLINPFSAEVEHGTTVKTGPSTASGWAAPSEQDAAFILGQDGWSIITGPSGAAGKGPYDPNADALAVRTTVTGVVEIGLFDAKSLGLPVDADKSSALTTNLAKNVGIQITEVKALSFPERGAVLDRLHALEVALRAGGGPVENVTFGIISAGGYATGIATSLTEKFRSLGLTDGAGAPLHLIFLGGLPADVIAERRSLVETFAKTIGGTGNPRTAPTARMEITQPVLEPFSLRPDATPAMPLGPNMEEAWLGALVVAQTVLGLLLAAIPTAAERQLNQLQPMILSQLRQYGGGVMLVGISWKQSNPNVDAVGDLAGGWQWDRWEWQFGPTADEAYGWYVTPSRLEVDRPGWYRVRWMWWFDGKTTTAYFPPELP